MLSAKIALPQTPGPSGFPVQMTFRYVSVKNVRPPQPHEQPTVQVEPNGRTDMNQAATEMVNGLAKSHDLNPREYVLVLASGDPGYFAMKPAPLGTPGAVKVSTYKNGKISLQVHELFGEDPELRPTVRKSCVPFLAKDQDGETVVVVGVKVGQDNPVQPRKSSKKVAN